MPTERLPSTATAQPSKSACSARASMRVMAVNGHPTSYHDCNATIQRVKANENQYTLHIQRIVEEGEAELAGDAAQSGIEHLVSVSLDTRIRLDPLWSEHTFQVTDQMHFQRTTCPESGGIMFQWSHCQPVSDTLARHSTSTCAQLEGQCSKAIVRWAFRPSASISAHTCQLFHFTMAQCIYEFTFKGKSFTEATDAEIQRILSAHDDKDGGGATVPNPVDGLVHHVAKMSLGHVLYTSAVTEHMTFYEFDALSGAFAPVARDVVLRISTVPGAPFAFVLQALQDTDTVCHEQPISASATQHLDRVAHRRAPRCGTLYAGGYPCSHRCPLYGATSRVRTACVSLARQHAPGAH